MMNPSFKLLLCLTVVFVTVSGFQLASNRCYRGSSASSLKMNIADRFFRIVKSSVNGVLTNLEDPEKILDQAVNDMQTDLVKIRQSYAEISATQKKMEKQKEQASSMADEWYKRAQLALSKNDEELAREALSRRQIQTVLVEDLDKAMSSQSAAIDKLYQSMGQLDAKILEAKRQKDTFIARARTAKTSVQVTDMLNSMTGSGSNSMEAFDRMKTKVEGLESQAEVAGELASSSSGAASPSMESRFKALEGDTKIDDELEQMRRQLPGSQKEVGQLPPSSS
jgi:phage shock protein A